MHDDHYWMIRALALAREAADDQEVPVGALVVSDSGELLGEGRNACITLHDPSAHAEIQAMRAAGLKRRNYRLSGATLYATLEPCAMCAGAIVHARIARVVYATPDPRAGAAGTVMNVLQHPDLNHKTEIEGGLEREAAAQLLVDFFTARRGKSS